MLRKWWYGTLMRDKDLNSAKFERPIFLTHFNRNRLPTGFELLHSRLVDLVTHKLRSGELTERGLARLAGVSQPHLHNVVKGVRLFSAQMADKVMEKLHVDLLTLLEDELASLETPWTSIMDVPLLAGSLGPGQPFPNLDTIAGMMPFLREDVAALLQPVAVRTTEDPAVRHLFHADDVLLMEPLQPEAAGRPVDFSATDSYYAIDAGASGLVRQVERQTDRLLLRGEQGTPGSLSIPLGDRHILQVVKARIVWIGRYLERPKIAARPDEETS